MSDEAAVATLELELPQKPPVLWRRLVPAGENLLVTAVLAAMIVIPLAEILLRRLLHTGIEGATPIVEHLTLVVGMIGGAIAAREDRLLSLSNLGGILKGRFRAASRVLAMAVAAAVTASLVIAGIQFVSEERGAGAVLAYSLPTWLIEAFIPTGFALITCYLIWHASKSWAGRLAAGALAAGMILFAARSPISPERLIWPFLIALLIATLIGVPVYVTLGGIALILFWGIGQPIGSITVDHYSLVTSPSLPTIPLFTLAGYFLAESRAPERLVRVFHALFTRIRGGSVLVTVMVCAFFTTFTGASGVTILALGGLLMPVLLKERYKEKHALGLLTSAGSLGLLFPPCLPLILYAIIAKVPMKDMFLGGLVPGVVMLAATSWWGFSRAPRNDQARKGFDWQEVRGSLWDAKWELLLPAVAFVALFSGWATPVEASAVTALYAFTIETLLHRDLKIFKDVPRVMTECGLLVGGVLLILGVALGFTNYLVDVEATQSAIQWTTNTIRSPFVFLLLLNGFLLIVGCLMDIYSAIVIQVPLLVPLGVAFHIDPVHLGIIFLANLEIGYLTPPVGLNLFLAAFRFKKPLPEVTRAALPVALVLLAAVLLITYAPWLTTALPNWAGR